MDENTYYINNYSSLVIGKSQTNRSAITLSFND